MQIKKLVKSQNGHAEKMFAVHIVYHLPKLLFKTKMTKVYSKVLLMKSSGSNFIFLPAFYLINWVMKATKNFGKITILKI